MFCNTSFFGGTKIPKKNEHFALLINPRFILPEKKRVFCIRPSSVVAFVLLASDGPQKSQGLILELDPRFWKLDPGF